MSFHMAHASENLESKNGFSLLNFTLRDIELGWAWDLGLGLRLVNHEIWFGTAIFLGWFEFISWLHCENYERRGAKKGMGRRKIKADVDQMVGVLGLGSPCYWWSLIRHHPAITRDCVSLLSHPSPIICYKTRTNIKQEMTFLMITSAGKVY